MKASSPSSAKRESWMYKMAEEDMKVMICNPSLVETGLDFCWINKNVFDIFSSEKIMMRAVKNREIMMLYVSDDEKDLAVMLPVKPNTKKDNGKSDEKPKKASEKTGGKKKK